MNILSKGFISGVISTLFIFISAQAHAQTYACEDCPEGKPCTVSVKASDGCNICTQTVTCSGNKWTPSGLQACTLKMCVPTADNSEASSALCDTDLTSSIRSAVPGLRQRIKVKNEVCFFRSDVSNMFIGNSAEWLMYPVLIDNAYKIKPARKGTSTSLQIHRKDGQLVEFLLEH